MGIVEANYAELFAMTTNAAKEILGGTGGGDYSEHAEDVAQDAIMALQGMDVTDKEELFKLGKTVAQNDARNLIRNENNRRSIEAENGDLTPFGEGDADNANPFDVYSADEMKKRIGTLSDTLKRTLQLIAFEGLSYPEVAEREGVSKSEIYERIRQAKENIA